MKIRFILIALMLLGLTSNVQAKIMTKTISYQHDGVNLEGFLAYDDSIKGKRPAVLVVHEWWGLNDYARSRAEHLAGMGYVAFALDMYGKGKVTQHPSQAGEWMKQVMIIYGGARHSFTNPGADKVGMDALKYSKSADLRSWADMKVFFEEIFQ